MQTPVICLLRGCSIANSPLFLRQGDAPQQPPRYLFIEVMLLCKPLVICSTEGCSFANPPLFVHRDDASLQTPHHLFNGGMLCFKLPVSCSRRDAPLQTSRYSFTGRDACQLFLQNSEFLGWFSCNLLMEQTVLLWVWSLQGKPSLC